jgi:multidrug efflux pump subunit AcrB
MSAALPRDPELKAQLLASAMPVFVGALRSPGDAENPPLLRIMLRARERQGAAEKQRLIAAVERCVAQEFPAQDNSSAGATTGFFVLLTNLIESLLADQWTTFAAATIGIAAMVYLLFRSVRLTLISLVPNALPIFLVMGLLGWLGLRVNMGAAMIAAVSMGMSVDSSIHYLQSYLLARRAGRDHDSALTEVQSAVGRAMLFSTLALVIGFAVLCTSEFVPTIYFGALVCLAMLGGLGGNLVVLPLLLSWFPPPMPGESQTSGKQLTVNGLPLVWRRLRGTTKQRRGVRPRGFMPGQAAFV